MAAPARTRTENGQPVPRVDGRLKVTGGARYPADIAVNNLAHAVLVTATIARGSVERLDLEAARAVPGVLDIVSYEEVAGQLAKPRFGRGSTSIGPLHEPQIRHDGQIVALVVAETVEIAAEAARLVRPEYRLQRPSAGFDAEGAETVDAAGTSEQFEKDPQAGDFDAAFAKAAVTVDLTYSTPTQHHNPIELYSTTAWWDDGHLVVHEPSQHVSGWKHDLAKQMQMDPSKVRVISTYVGGAFGGKGPITPRTAIVALAAKRLNRPVRCVVSRGQAYGTQTYRAETRHRIRIGTGVDGKIAAFSHEGWEVTSRPDPYVVGGTEMTTRLYGYGAVASKVRLVKADRNTPGYMRSPPEVPYVYALECAMDEMAHALRMDPVEFRRVNDAKKEPIEGKPFSSRPLMRCYDEAAKAFRWGERDAAIASMRDGDWLVGMGCATAVYPANLCATAARVRLSADGKARIETAAHEIGTGIRTIAAQMVAEQLGLKVEDVEVAVGDSALPSAPVAGGSNTTASVCSTIMKACAPIRGRLFKAATEKGAKLSGRDIGRLELKDGKAVGPAGGEMPLEEIFERLGIGTIEEYAEWKPDGAPEDAFKKLAEGESVFVSGTDGKKVKYAFGAEFVEVRIHRLTREIRVPRIVGAFAGGRIMNPRTARSQLTGGMIWGIGSALHEVTEIDERAARYVNRDIAEYLIPVNADIRQLEVILVPEVDADVNPAGVKGLGELGNVGTAAAIANAVFHATGVRIRDLPIRIDDLIA